MNEIIPLWAEGAPGFEAGYGQPQPFLQAYPLPGVRDAVLILPGGGYHHLAPYEGEPVAQAMRREGLSAFVLHYRHAPYVWPVPLRDAQRALRLVRVRLDAEAEGPHRVAAMGFSAGGHLAGMLGTESGAGTPDADDPVERRSARPDALALCYPVISMQAFVSEASLQNLTGHKNASFAVRRALSVEERVTADTPPAFLWHTADDANVPVENSLMMANAMSRAGVPFALHVFAHGRHGLGLGEQAGEDVRAWPALCGQWLRSVGFGAQAAAESATR